MQTSSVVVGESSAMATATATTTTTTAPMPLHSISQFYKIQQFILLMSFGAVVPPAWRTISPKVRCAITATTQYFYGFYKQIKTEMTG